MLSGCLNHSWKSSSWLRSRRIIPNCWNRPDRPCLLVTAPDASMSNYAWVCFDCRMAIRRPGSAKDVRCPGCAKPCECLGYKIPVPPKSKTKVWERLRETWFASKRPALLRSQRQHVRFVHDTEREIARLRVLPEVPGRLKTIDCLIKRLRRHGA